MKKSELPDAAAREVAEALAAWKASANTGRAAAVAEAAEGEFPAEAAAIYRKLAESQIDARNRGAYQEACRYLAKAGKAMARAGVSSEFQHYLSALLEKYRALRAFKEEVQKAKLVVELPPTAVRLKKPR